ncbi:unnamed protein product [Orchesella dallaii]|uniref:Sodium channel protein Nach n=1 Tax=Orchesella dallaii TaxID=48710 RepID=A0ABP1QP02_9HEXA
MARISESTIFERRFLPNGPKPSIKSNFITSSSISDETQYPLNYPYNIYNLAWDTDRLEKSVGVEKDNGCSCGKVCWWYPDQDSVPAEYLESSSMHGLKYVSQPKRHLIERIFWFGAFLASLISASIMIMEIWNRYYENPVIVTFNPTELDLETIPFPAVTICNMNPFKRSRVNEFQTQYREGLTAPERKQALEALRVINGLCSSQQSFLKSLKFAPKRGDVLISEAKEVASPEMEKNLTQFLLHNTQPCSELIRFCVWEQQQIPCEKLFKPILTDYGKCCTFNMLPQELMEHNVTSTLINTEGKNKNPAWNKSEVDEWRKWDFGEGYLLKPESKYPYRQRRAGMIDGLSLLIDSDIENSFCPSSDSEGLKVLFHVPLDTPRVADLGSIIGVDQEVFVEVNPDLTIADEEITSYSHEKRKCYFGNASTNVCSSAPNAPDSLCIKENERRYLGRLNRLCRHCKYSCNDLSYNSEVTFASLQSKDILWGDGINGTRVDWMSNRISILHIFMGSDTVVPKLRQKLYQTVDLIANTGGLLGLSIGFSVLSAVEIIYFATMRICCRRIRKSTNYGPGPSTTQSENLNNNNVKNYNNLLCHYRKSYPNAFNRLPSNNGNLMHGQQHV